MNRFKEFESLMHEMANDTLMSSNSKACVKHPNFDKLKEFEDVIPFTCLFLDTYIHQCWALLYRLLPENKLPPPLPPYYSGRVPVYKEAFKYWALREKYVTVKYDPESYWVEDKYGNRAEWH